MADSRFEVTFRYRQLDANFDMTFGNGGQNFLVDSPAAVAQSVLTRLLLWQGEWYIDLLEGTPWMQQILGKPRRPGLPDAAIRQRILDTPFVTQIIDYASVFDSTARSLTISCKIFTAFGPVTVPPPGTAISPSGALVINIGGFSAETALVASPQRLLSR